MLFDRLKEYSKGSVYPFHMPGHKRRRVGGSLPYELDLTEINGFDDLHNPGGCIRDIERKAEELFGVARAFLLINGATGGILAAVRAMTHHGGKVIIARNCHRSVYHAAELCCLEPVYLIPPLIGGADISGSVPPEQVERLLSENRDAELVVITSPTYEGVCSNIESISAICRRYGARLLVDEAHGSHFPFSAVFPKAAVQSGADAAVISLHKTLPSLTQTALLLTDNSDLEKSFQKQLAVFETSSPSYLLMSGIELCLRYIERNSFLEYCELLSAFYEESKKLKKLKLLYPCEKGGLIYDYDPGKLVVLTQGTGLTGKRLAALLRETYDIETEMSSARYLTAMTSVCDTAEGFKRLITALIEIDREILRSDYSKEELNIAEFTEPPQKCCSPWECFRFKPREVEFDKSAGKVSLEYIYAYPPGIPFIVPGEVIGAETIKRINSLLSNGVEIISTDKNMPERITVADF